MNRSLHGRIAVRAAMAALAAPVISACSDAPTTPRVSSRALTPLLNASVASWTPQRYPNAVKYRNTGAKPATGRSGSAALEARALLGKNHETTFEVTTGSLEGGQAAPGNLEKVQVKIFDPQWHEVSTTNYTHLQGGGYATYSFTGLAPNSGFQVQANVAGIDPNRTDVVTVRGTTKLRPDLAVYSIVANRALVGVPVEIIGTVRELNGDVGARADCVLSVDGTRVASADGIWVDARGDVSCSFSLVFPTTGTKTLVVSAVNVVPGDYDDGNNSRTATIVVESAVPGFRFFAEATEWTESFHYVFDWWFKDGPDANGFAITYDEHWDADQVDDFQHGFMFGSLDREISFPLRDVQFSHTTDGNVLAARNFGTLEPTYFFENDDVRYACVNHFTPLDGNQGYVSVGVCSGAYKSGPLEGPWSFMSIHRQHNEVTYSAIASEGEYRIDFPDGTSSQGTWFYNYLFEQPRVLPHYGSDLTINFSFEAGGSIYRQTAAIPMAAFDRQIPDEVYRCSEYTPTPTRQERVCLARSSWRMWGVEGRLTGTGTVEPTGGLTP